MDYDDSSGTDDDLPPPRRNRFPQVSRAAGNAISGVQGTAKFSQMHGDMESQIHLIEQKAYSSILRAFKAQSDAISWEKESLITELRKELRVSDEEHRELLSSVNADDIIGRIREWRKTGGLQSAMRSNAQPIHDPAPSPTVSASHKKQKASQSVASLSLNAPTPAFRQSLPPFSVLKQGPASAARGKKSKPSMQYTSTVFTGTDQVQNGTSLSAHMVNEAAEAAKFDPLIGRKVWTRWPADNSFYEAVITDYDPAKGLHALVYDINTEHTTWEWVNLKEISAEDIRWDGEAPGISSKSGHTAPGRGFKKSMSRGGSVAGTARGRGATKSQSEKQFLSLGNIVGKKGLSNIELLHTDTLIKEVEKVFSASQPNPVEFEKARKVLKDHEEALIDAIARLEDASDGESDPREKHSSDQERGSRKWPPDDIGREVRGNEDSDGNKTAKAGTVGSDNGHDDK